MASVRSIYGLVKMFCFACHLLARTKDCVHMASSRFVWKMAESMPVGSLAEVSVRSPITRQLLWNRGVQTAQAAQAFFAPNWESDLHDPLQFRHLEPAANRLFSALQANERITVHGDYDADGVTGSALLLTTLREIERRLTGRSLPDSCTDFYIPHRDAEGYGLHERTVQLLHERGTKVIVTVDCGIACVAEIASARALGMDVIVVDHHQFGEVLPEAWLIHPGLPQETYPFKKLAAVGVAFKFACALLTRARERGVDIPTGWEKWLLDFVSIATVTDMVGLVGENRLLEQYGLRVLRKTRRPGFLALFEAAKLDQGTLSAESVGFAIGPRLNAAGRMDHAQLALRLLLAESLDEARVLANELERCNRARQEATRAMMMEAEQLVQDQSMQEWPLQVVWHEAWSPSLVGLVAGRLMERSGRPVVAIGKHGDRWIGSGRSPALFDITEAVRGAGEGILTRSGGHVQACGFSLESEDSLPLFRDRLIAWAKTRLEGRRLDPELLIDAEVGLGALSWDLWEDLAACEPFGMENPRPTFAIRGAFVAKVSTLGEGKHLRLDVLDQGTKVFKCMGFSYPTNAYQPKQGDRIDIAVQLAVNEWNGTRSLEGRIMDVRLASA